MAVSVSNQALIFFYSVFGGMLIGFSYDLFRVKRKFITTGLLMVHIEDFIYWLLVALIMFAVVYNSNDGEIRGYIFIGTILGSIIYILSLSHYVIKVLIASVNVIANVIKVLAKIIIFPLRIIFKFLYYPYKFLRNIFRKFLKYIKGFLKIRFTKLRVVKKLFLNILKKI